MYPQHSGSAAIALIKKGQQTIRGWVGYKYTRTMGLSMGGQSDHNTIRIPALCHKLFRTMKNKIIKLEGKTFCTIYFRLGPAIATVKALAHLSHQVVGPQLI